MPISSLPSGEGVGTLGKYAYNFADFLQQADAGIWQTLPLVPTNYGDSPYQSCSPSAVNYYFIDLQMLVGEGFLTQEEVAAADLVSCGGRVDYGKQFYNKIPLLRTAFGRFNVNDGEFVRFVNSGKYADFAVFMALKCKFGHRAWTEWEQPYRIYDEKIVRAFAAENAQEILFWQFTQFIFLKQWRALKGYANERGIKLMGDIPLYVAYDSVEMWKWGNALFKVDAGRNMSSVAGVPPDAFTDDGQLWGNPLYDWEKMKEDGYAWWNQRLKDAFSLFDILRIDHFRGFDRYYAVPFGEKTARNGVWEKGPAEALFEDKKDWSVVAEDLGVIDDGVVRMMKNLGFPGMKILEFAFDGNERNEHKPSNYTANYVCYTGTHDNMPLRQYIDDLSEEQLDTFISDVKKECALLDIPARTNSSQELTETVIKLAFASAAFAAVIPLSDVLALGKEARMNLPATVSCDNWSFRFGEGDFNSVLAKKLKALAEETRRNQNCGDT